MRGRCHVRAGFTLVEIILSMTLIGITVAVTSVLMGRGLDAYNLVNDRSVALDQARYALARMEKEMTKVSEINTAKVNEFGFRDDLGANTDFHLQGTALFRGADRLSSNVNHLVFTYYRDNGNVTNAPLQVRRIHVDLEVSAGNSSIFLRTDIFPRTFLYENFK